MRISKEDRRKIRKKRDRVRFELDADKMEEKSLRYFRIRIKTTTADREYLLIGILLRALTSVIDSDQAKHWRPNDYQDEGRPAVVQRSGASGNGHDVVPARLHDVMNEYHVNRGPKTE